MRSQISTLLAHILAASVLTMCASAQVVNPARQIAAATQTFAPSNLTGFTQTLDARRGYIVNLTLTNSISNAVAVALDLPALGSRPYPLVLQVTCQANSVTYPTNHISVSNLVNQSGEYWFNAENGFYWTGGDDRLDPTDGSIWHYGINGGEWRQVYTCDSAPTGTLTAVNTWFIWGTDDDANKAGDYPWNAGNARYQRADGHYVEGGYFYDENGSSLGGFSVAECSSYLPDPTGGLSVFIEQVDINHYSLVWPDNCQSENGAPGSLADIIELATVRFDLLWDGDRYVLHDRKTNLQPVVNP